MCAKDIYETAKNNYNNGVQNLPVKGKILRAIYSYGLIDAEAGRNWIQRREYLPNWLMLRLGKVDG